jgi:hypothetical protein
VSDWVQVTHALCDIAVAAAQVVVTDNPYVLRASTIHFGQYGLLVPLLRDPAALAVQAAEWAVEQVSGRACRTVSFEGLMASYTMYRPSCVLVGLTQPLFGACCAVCFAYVFAPQALVVESLLCVPPVACVCPSAVPCVARLFAAVSSGDKKLTVSQLSPAPAPHEHCCCVTTAAAVGPVDGCGCPGASGRTLRSQRRHDAHTASHQRGPNTGGCTRP